MLTVYYSKFIITFIYFIQNYNFCFLWFFVIVATAEYDSFLCPTPLSFGEGAGVR
jgi:hypothetical protein